MTLIALILFGYIIPFYLGYKYVQIAYSKGGRWEPLNPNITDLLFTIIPFFNLVFYIVWVTGHPRNKPINLNTFFKIKK